MSRVKPWRELGREPLADCRIFTLERSRAESPHDAREREFVRIRSDDWVQIVPVTSAGEIVMVRQYRHGPSKITLEIPGGFVDRGEPPAEAAVRECLEETGYAAREVHALGSLNPNPALFTNRLHAFYAHGVERVAEIQNTGTEQTELVLVPARDLRALLRDNAVDHALVVATLWRYVSDILEPE